MLKAPFPWFGGKSRAASLIWERFGDVANYVEPFAGSLAVLLARPTQPSIETVNDLDCHVANFWRAVQSDPDAVAKWCDWPVNEADLHARHLWLVQNLPAHRERMMTDPDHFDAKIAGWWVWGLCQWIGSGWCAEKKPAIQLPHVGGAGMGVHRKRPHVGGAGRGVFTVKPGRELALATTKMQEACMWAIRGVAMDPANQHPTQPGSETTEGIRLNPRS